MGILSDNFFTLGGETIVADCSYSVPVRYVSKFSSVDQVWRPEDFLPYDLFRFSGVSYESSTTKAIYMFGGQTEFTIVDSNTGYYALSDMTIKYMPDGSRVGSSSKVLKAGEIAGIVIGSVVFVLICALGRSSYCKAKVRN